MFIGSCYYCDSPFMTASPDRTPAYEKYKCEECGEEQWLKHSRIDPESYPIEYFIADETTHRLVKNERFS